MRTGANVRSRTKLTKQESIWRDELLARLQEKFLLKSTTLFRCCYNYNGRNAPTLLTMLILQATAASALSIEYGSMRTRYYQQRLVENF